MCNPKENIDTLYYAVMQEASQTPDSGMEIHFTNEPDSVHYLRNTIITAIEKLMGKYEYWVHRKELNILCAIVVKAKSCEELLPVLKRVNKIISQIQ